MRSMPTSRGYVRAAPYGAHGAASHARIFSNAYGRAQPPGLAAERGVGPDGQRPAAQERAHGAARDLERPRHRGRVGVPTGPREPAGAAPPRTGARTAE